MHPARTPTEPHMVTIQWTGCHLTPLQVKRIGLFYGKEAVTSIKGRAR